LHIPDFRIIFVIYGRNSSDILAMNALKACFYQATIPCVQETVKAPESDWGFIRTASGSAPRDATIAERIVPLIFWKNG
jgi:hypothetical protein